jgi:hypothetical protein
MAKSGSPSIPGAAAFMSEEGAWLFGKKIDNPEKLSLASPG